MQLAAIKVLISININDMKFSKQLFALFHDFVSAYLLENLLLVASLLYLLLSISLSPQLSIF